MDHYELERVIQLHTRDTQIISYQVREKVFTNASDADASDADASEADASDTNEPDTDEPDTDESDTDEPDTDASASKNVSVIPSTCRGDSVGDPLRLPNSILASDSTLAEEDLAYVVEGMLHRASSGSVALTVLEDCFSDSRRGNRSVCITAYAEHVDVHGTGVFDRHGCQWPLLPVIDRFKLACKGWKCLASVTGESVNTSVRLATALRGVVATTYGYVCTHKLPSSGGMLAVALGNTSMAAAGAVAVVSACPRGMEFIQGEASMRLPCGSVLKFEALYNDEAKRVNEVILRIRDYGRMSHARRVTVNVLGMVLMGAGVLMTVDIVKEDDTAALDKKLAGILKMQSAVQCRVLQTVHDVSSEENMFLVHDLVRCLTIYRICCAESLKGDERNYGDTENERIAIAREEALDIMLSDERDIGEWDIGEYLGEDSDRSESYTATSSCDSEGWSFESDGEETWVPGFGGEFEDIPKPPTPVFGLPKRASHDRFGTSDVPLLSSDITTNDGVRIRAQRGVALQPDPRRFVVIRKGRFLWGRVIFENGCFASRSLINGPSVLRAVVPVQSLTIGFVGFQQFDAESVQGRGSDVANMLLSGMFGADAALWAFKKILFSGHGLKPGFEPSYLAGMKGRVEEDGFGIASVLGCEAVKAMEVLVKDDRIFLNAKGDFETLEVRKVGRGFKCVTVRDDIEYAWAGTIDTRACMF